LVFLLILPSLAPAKKINGDAELVTEMLQSVVGDSETLKRIKKDLKVVKNEYTKEKGGQITWGTPAEFTQMGEHFYVISFNATISSPNPEMAIFSLLYEKQDTRELEYAKSYLTWIGQTELEGLSSISTVSLCTLFENLTGGSICQAEKEKQVFTSEIEDLEARLQQQLSQTAAKTHLHSADDITGGSIKESLIDDAICRDAELSVAVSALMQEINARPLPDVDAGLELTNATAEVEALKAQIDELQETVTRLSAILEGISREGSDFIFSGMNVYVVSGSGTTDAAPNGLGNLIVGYNEKDTQNKDNFKVNAKGGSHNLVIGKSQTYTSYGGIVAGASNSISAPYASITGGFNNTAEGSFSSVSGGQLNSASGDYATVSGGLARKAEGNNNWSAGEQTSGK
jgi:hypothetical protein